MADYLGLVGTSGPQKKNLGGLEKRLVRARLQYDLGNHTIEDPKDQKTDVSS